MTNITTYTPGHYSSTERVFSQLPALFNDDWLNTVVNDWEKAFEVKNAVYPYNIKAIKNAEGGADKYIVEVALAGVGKNNIDVKAVTAQFKGKLMEFSNRYPLINKFDSHANENDVCEYVNLVDTVKGI